MRALLRLFSFPLLGSLRRLCRGATNACVAVGSAAGPQSCILLTTGQQQGVPLDKKGVALTRQPIAVRIANVLLGEKANKRAIAVHERCTTPGCLSHGKVQFGECDECYFARQL